MIHESLARHGGRTTLIMALRIISSRAVTVRSTRSVFSIRVIERNSQLNPAGRTALLYCGRPAEAVNVYFEWTDLAAPPTPVIAPNVLRGAYPRCHSSQQTSD